MNKVDTEENGIRLTDEEKARRSRRNLAIALSVGGLCALFYLITVFKIGSAILKRSL
ncbi:MAG TPA: hypothetical protein PKW21_13360 [Rhabdaerophilum sp.]|nr:hypothetical protein [Rhabdaerophilum sp.]